METIPSAAHCPESGFSGLLSHFCKVFISFEFHLHKKHAQLGVAITVIRKFNLL